MYFYLSLIRFSLILQDLNIANHSALTKASCAASIGQSSVFAKSYLGTLSACISAVVSKVKR
ncbi:hypothetical protein IC006_2245 [Sulfuracidifex tepidarius]|uniref:Uncharacterized protein n=1 Tax=Sulfuracidifex tepidarius TaxID=1294262 RepID=A0A510DXF5_9CREN|nr:hypothetical protein IC006_2245 [Sulfuracidifex tepidarius]